MNNGYYGGIVFNGCVGSIFNIETRGNRANNTGGIGFISSNITIQNSTFESNSAQGSVRLLHIIYMKENTFNAISNVCLFLFLFLYYYSREVQHIFPIPMCRYPTAFFWITMEE